MISTSHKIKYKICLVIYFLIVIVTIVVSVVWRLAEATDYQLIKSIESGAITFQTEVSVPSINENNSAMNPASEVSNDLVAGVSKEQFKNILDKAYPLLAAKWPYNNIFVCWENPEGQSVKYLELVETAVSQTWQRYSALNFIGWDKCYVESAGVRIKIIDSRKGPKVKYLGKYLEFDIHGEPRVLRNGVTLNFSFEKWGNKGCKNSIEQCIYTVAVHEFGHVIGFAHEHNRPDKDGECNLPPQGDNGDTLLTSWDPESVLNYCNPEWGNKGVLSKLDVAAVQHIYGI